MKTSGEDFDKNKKKSPEKQTFEDKKNIKKNQKQDSETSSFSDKENEGVSELEELLELSKQDNGTGNDVDKSHEKLENNKEGQLQQFQNSFIESVSILGESRTSVLEKINELPEQGFLEDSLQNFSRDEFQETTINYEPASMQRNYSNSVYESERRQLDESFNFIVKHAERIAPKELISSEDFLPERRINLEINPELREIQSHDPEGLMEEYYHIKYEKIDRSKVKLPFEEENQKYKPRR